MSHRNAGESQVATLFDVVKQRYGHRLAPDELEEVRKDVEAVAEAAEAVGAVKLGDGDGPFLVFAPYRKEG